ncbi:hypothetical protein SLS60_008658 [Paraconiothyrium brasiliense]|uniref:Uncharacterized protein n=1 Tax=Paraconiothyrium brasiliense TaxID=300254 RepID=A0ABR3QY37_9PLEO
MVRFLEDVDICWRGSRGKLFLDVYIVHQYAMPQSCWDDYMAMELYYVKSLKKAIEMMKRCGLQDDHFFNPMVTDLTIAVPPNEWVIMDHNPIEEREPRLVHIHNADGVRLQQILPALVFANKLGFDAWLESVDAIEPRLDTWDSWLFPGMQLDMSHRFPTLEDYAAYVEGWSDRVQRFREIRKDIDGLMSSIEAWHWSEWPRKG